VRNGPLVFSDPAGLELRAETKEAQADICALVGPDCANKVGFAGNGAVSLSATPGDLSSNAALSFLKQVVDSGNVYGAWVGTELPVKGGKVTLGSGEGERLGDNYSITDDKRIAAEDKPPDGYAGVAGVFSGIETAANVQGAGGLPVSRPLGLLHELAENFAITEGGLQYKEGHAAANRVEAQVRAQRPDLTRFALAGGPYRRTLP
jgi:hypothetical protein